MIQHEFDPRRSSARVSISGELTEKAALDWFQRFLDEVSQGKRVSGIVDTRDVTDLAITSQGVRQLTELVEAYDAVFAGSHWAFVASADALFGMARMYEMLRGEAPYEIRVFREMEPARAWIADPRHP